MVEISESAQSRFEVSHAEGGVALVRFSGDWLLRSGMTSAETILAELDQGPKPERLVVDFSGVGRWDSALVSLVVQLNRLCRDR
ncbi:MAG: STAS domain-containing protein, partial [Desulfuromonadales bacterium]|nr:STAS domain-containing protein [Desulfuromonadales bacterium]